jgi:hypothetical protein
MKYVLCKHRVKDFSVWYTIFSSHKEAQEKAGFHLLHLLRDSADDNHVVYLFALKDPNAEKAFTETPDAREAGETSGFTGEPEILILSDELIV